MKRLFFNSRLKGTTEVKEGHTIVNEVRAAQPREATVELWVDEYADDLFRFARLRVRDQHAAEELVQEVFLAALKSFDSFRGDSNPSTWLIGLLRHKIADHYRRLSRERATEDATTDSMIDGWFDRRGAWIKEPSHLAFDPAVLGQREDFWLVFEQCLRSLPTRVAQAFSLRVLDDMDAKSVCKVLSVSSTNLWVMLHRARARLRVCLEANWFEREIGEKG